MKALLSIALTFDFATAIARDNVYNKIKTALANAKSADAWESGNLRKYESVAPESTQEAV